MIYVVRILCLLCLLLPAATSHAAIVHDGYALTLYGTPKYPKGFTHTDYVNPKAPKGGRIKLAEQGTFDSLNPYILKGVKAPNIRMLFQSLMTQSLDEPMTMYLSVADSVSLAKDGSSARFTIHPNARWHDGAPITAEDVVFSFNTLKQQGDPTYAIYYKPIDNVVADGRAVTFYFNDPSNRELPFAAASMPILPKHYYAAHAFDQTTLTPPLGSGPYKVGKVDIGRAIEYARVDDWWAKDLPINKGLYNFATLHYDMYRDSNVSLEAFKASNYDFRREYIARNWAAAYASPALSQGKFIKRELHHKIPQGMQAFAFNTRKPYLSDRRVREAISLAMDFDWLNSTLFYDAYTRNTSFFGNTEFAATGLPSEEEKALLTPYSDTLPPGLLTTPLSPITKAEQSAQSGQSARESLLRAQALLNEAGYMVVDGKRVHAATGKPLSIEFLLRQPTMERVIGQMRKNLERLGISSSIRNVDDAQYQQRLDGFDFDIISVWLNNGVFFPGNEQLLYWHSSQADVKGASNITGLKSPAADHIINQLVAAQDLRRLTPAARALDRLLLAEHVIIPHWHSQSFRIAYWNKFAMPPTPPNYDIGLMTWWVEE